MERFTASVQYGDWKGTAAADNADQNDLADLLRAKNLMQPDEFLVGVRVFIGENHGGKVKDPYIEVLIATTNNFDTVKAFFDATPDPIPLRKVALQLTLVEFLGLFKRLEIAIGRDGLGLSGREYESQQATLILSR